jgi:hypothetical protein
MAHLVVGWGIAGKGAKNGVKENLRKSLKTSRNTGVFKKSAGEYSGPASRLCGPGRIKRGSDL